MTTVALVGAGGKMGCRITDNMKKQAEYRMLHVEVADAGRRRLAERRVTPVAAANERAEASPRPRTRWARPRADNTLEYSTAIPPGTISPVWH